MRRGLATYEPGSMEGWLSRITTNAFLDEVRKRKRRPADAVAETCPSPPSPSKAIPRRSWLARCSPTTCRRRSGPSPRSTGPPIVLCDVLGYDYAEIAAPARRPDRHRAQPHPSRPGPAAEGPRMTDDRTLPPDSEHPDEELLSAYLDGVLDPAEAEAVRRAPRDLRRRARADLEQLQLVREVVRTLPVRGAAVRLLRAHAPPRSPPVEHHVAALRVRRDRRHRRHGRRGGHPGGRVVARRRGPSRGLVAGRRTGQPRRRAGRPSRRRPARRPASVARPLPVPGAPPSSTASTSRSTATASRRSGSPGGMPPSAGRPATASPVTDVVAVDDDGWMVRVRTRRRSPSSSGATASTRWSARRARTSPRWAAALPEDQLGSSIADRLRSAGRSLLEAFGVGD